MKLGSLIRGKASGLKTSFKSELSGNEHSKTDRNGSDRKIKADDNNAHRKEEVNIGSTDIDTPPKKSSSGECICHMNNWFMSPSFAVNSLYKNV